MSHELSSLPTALYLAAAVLVLQLLVLLVLFLDDLLDLTAHQDAEVWIAEQCAAAAVAAQNAELEAQNEMTDTVMKDPGDLHVLH